MHEPTGDEVHGQLRALLPERLHAEFDDDYQFFRNPEENTSSCAAFMGFSWTFDRLIAAHEAETIRMA